MKYFPCQLKSVCTLNHSCFVSVSQDYSQLYDLSRSERSKVHELAVTMATDGQPLERIGELLRVAVGPLDLSIKSVLRDAVERVVAALRYYISVCSIFLIKDTVENKNSEAVTSSPVKTHVHKIFPLTACTMKQRSPAVQQKKTFFSILEKYTFCCLAGRYIRKSITLSCLCTNCGAGAKRRLALA